MCALVVLCFFVLLAPRLLAQAGDPSQPKNILVLYSFSDRNLFDPLDNLKAAIRSRVNAPVNFYVHYLEAQGLEDPNYDHSLSENLRSELRGVKLDVVITAVYSSYQFALRHRDELFPGVPVVFSYVHASRVDGKQLPPGVTGVTVSVGIRNTLELAFKLHPGTENLAVVAGSSEFERFWRAAVRNQFGPYAEKVKSPSSYRGSLHRHAQGFDLLEDVGIPEAHDLDHEAGGAAARPSGVPNPGLILGFEVSPIFNFHVGPGEKVKVRGTAPSN